MFSKEGSGPPRFGAGTSVAGLHVDALEEVLPLGGHVYGQLAFQALKENTLW